MRTILLLGFLAASFAALAAPRPVRPAVDTLSENNHLRVRLQQDGCWAWSTPVVSRTGNTFTITQTVTPRSPCSTVADVTDVVSDQLPVGTYRLVYRATAIDMPAIADYSQEFFVAPAAPRSLRVYPTQPTALEPVVARVSLTDTCEFVTGVRPADGGFAIMIRSDYSNPVSCDADSTVSIALGSFPPGTYPLTLVRLPEEGGQELARTQFTVGPSTLGVVRTPWADLSGIWTAADEEPGTALSLIHTLDRDANNLLRDAIVGLWYSYDESGRAVWYYIEANTDGASSFGSSHAGTISQYRSTNPAAPAFDRSLAGDPVGTIQFSLFGQTNPGRITGTLRGQPFDIRVERFPLDAQRMAAAAKRASLTEARVPSSLGWPRALPLNAATALMARFLAVVGLVAGVGCSSSARIATYADSPSGAALSIELYPAHPTLAEYDRVLVLATKGSGTRHHRLAMDTGGYSAANLYKCSGHELMLDSYGEIVTVDASSGLIRVGPCIGSRRYLGAFDGGGSRPWQFFPASERPEEALVMSGG